jgi:hypothetical protein
MTAREDRNALPGAKRLLDDPQLLLGGPSTPARHTGDDLDPLVVVRHKPVPRGYAQASLPKPGVRSKRGPVHPPRTKRKSMNSRRCSTPQRSSDFSCPSRSSGSGDGHDHYARPFTRPEPSRAEPSRAEPSRAEPSRAEPSRAEPSRAEPSRAEPSRAEPRRWRNRSAL